MFIDVSLYQLVVADHICLLFCRARWLLFLHHEMLIPPPAPPSGSLDSNWIVGATLEKKLLPLPLSLVLCTFLNHRKNKFQCGFGVTIG